MHFRLQLAVLVLGATLAGSAVARQPISEETLEASGSMLSMPAAADGVLVVYMCASCKPMSLRANATTQYFFNHTPVTLKEMTDYVRAHGDAFAGVNYDTKTLALKRIRVSVPK